MAILLMLARWLVTLITSVHVKQPAGTRLPSRVLCDSIVLDPVSKRKSFRTSTMSSKYNLLGLFTSNMQRTLICLNGRLSFMP
jgi:hypothetical protein